MARTHPIMRFGTSGGIQEVNPNDRDWQAYLGLKYQGIRALVRARWPSANQAAAAATITSLTPNTTTNVAGGVVSVAVVGTGLVVGQTVFTFDGVVIQSTVTSATAATIMVPRSPVGTHQIRALNPGRTPSAASTFTVT